MKLLLALGSFLFFSLNLSSQMNKIDFEEFELENGLHVILHQDQSTPIVSVSVMYHVGSKNEKPDRTGFAHFFEHLLFEGSDNIPRGEFFKMVERAGGTLNANTSYDRTYYYEILPSNQLELGLWLESERMLHARVDQEGIETQREVVKEERRLRYDNSPYGALVMETMKRLFKDHSYKWPPIGAMEHLNAAQEEDYKQFYEDFYVPNNAILTIAGDIDIDQAKMLAAKYFETIPKSTKPIFRPNVVEGPLGGMVRDTAYDNNIQLPAIVQAYKVPAQGTVDYYPVLMMGRLLSRGQSSRMYKSLVDEKKLVVQSGNFPIPLEDVGVSVAYGIGQMGVDGKDIEDAIQEEIDKIQVDLISDLELQKLKNQIENDFISGNASIAGVAESLSNYAMYYGDANLINSELDRYLKVTKEDIKRVANEYFNEDNKVVLYYLPSPKTP